MYNGINIFKFRNCSRKVQRVVCPVTLKSKLREIWHEKSHDVIGSVMTYKGLDGDEVEDESYSLHRIVSLFFLAYLTTNLDTEKIEKFGGQ
ncbi:hypothetical protein ACHAW6_002968 [Cyclotella cf. meneghiniana]